MKRKYLMYAMLPTFALALVTGGVASAHGMMGLGISTSLTPEQIAARQQELFQREADLLGVSVDDVKNAWAQGKTLEQLASEKGITSDQLRQKMLDQRKQDMKKVLASLVSKGIITQAQADQRSAFIDKQAASVATHKNLGRGMGRHGMGMGFGF